jgi:hypothetical protein
VRLQPLRHISTLRGAWYAKNPGDTRQTRGQVCATRFRAPSIAPDCSIGYGPTKSGDRRRHHRPIAAEVVLTRVHGHAGGDRIGVDQAGHVICS